MTKYITLAVVLTLTALAQDPVKTTPPKSVTPTDAQILEVNHIKADAAKLSEQYTKDMSKLTARYQKIVTELCGKDQLNDSNWTCVTSPPAPEPPKK